MAKHYCIDPHDPFAQAEVLVEFEGAYPTITLISAIDADQEDVLPDLVEEQIRDLSCDRSFLSARPHRAEPEYFFYPVLLVG